MSIENQANPQSYKYHKNTHVKERGKRDEKKKIEREKESDDLVCRGVKINAVIGVKLAV